MPAAFRMTLRPPSHPTRYHLTFAVNRHSQLADPLGHDAFDVVLPKAKRVVMPRGEVADAQRDQVNVYDRIFRSLRNEPISDAPLIENFDRARLQAARAGADELLAGPPLDNGNVDSGQGQLGRQHQPRRTAPRDHHRMRAHIVTPNSAGLRQGRRC
jgi:hypothetical protein